MSAGNDGTRRHSSDRNNSYGKTQSQLAKEIGVDQSVITKYKKLLTLIPELQTLIETGQMSSTVGYKVWAKIPQEEQTRLVEELGAETISKMTQKQTKEYKEKLEETKKDVKQSKEYKALQSQVDSYQTNLDNLNNKIREQEERLAVFEKKKADTEVLMKNAGKIEEREVENVSYDNLINMLNEYDRFTNIYTFKGGIYKSLSSEEQNEILRVCKTVVLNTQKIINNIKGE